MLLDPNIRAWVFLPIILITFLVGVVRHYIAKLFMDKPIDSQQHDDTQILTRARALRDNAHLLTHVAFEQRRHYFNHPETGVLSERPAEPVRPTPNPMSDPNMLSEMLKSNMTNVLPMIVIGGWINWMFTGFVATRIPFRLTLRFKPMLQRGVELVHLDASWVSSASWYFLNVFGLRAIYALVLGEQDQFMDGVPMPAAPTDTSANFKSEWETLQMLEHRWSLENIVKEVSQFK